MAPRESESKAARLIFESTKTYEHNIGLSCCFRQHRAQSHCSRLHGYSLLVKLTFVAQKSDQGLDENGWVVDFGSLKDIKKWLEDTFDHKTLVACDDPQLPLFRIMDREGLLDMVICSGTGCERFAEQIFRHVEAWMDSSHTQIITFKDRVDLLSVEVREHGANSAIVRNAKYGA